MSTFDGIVPEFPEIQIDYFRKNPERPAPLACFLSHVHNDHLQGLESFRAPFIYCSRATRELLLRIEKYPHRINFHKGILESRRVYYKHLAKLLRPIPLNTPTEIELTPRRRIRVTLFDANHCTGAVMFLIEGDGKAILYTGDIRAEKWWINSVARHPILIPYTLGRRRLDKLYLDTTFARASNPLREFPSKAEGLAELLRKIEAYPEDTLFYFRAWTFGYEDVWIALSGALNTKVHVDQYQMRLYRSLANGGNAGTHEAPALCGFDLGNKAVAGCLSDSESSRIHSCEPGMSCSPVRNSKTVYITPIVNRTRDGAEVPEIGTGGGIGDLYQVHELELPDESTLAKLENLCLKHINDEERLAKMRNVLSGAFRSRKKALSLDEYGVKEEGDISLEKLVTMLGRGLSKEAKPDLPNTIRFPYSRHSSYSELCELVATFRPKDIHPCTVDPASWSEDVSIQRLFGHLCSGNDFSHDAYMYDLLGDREEEENQHPRKRARYDEDLSTQSTQASSLAEEGHASLNLDGQTSGTWEQTCQPSFDQSVQLLHPQSSSPRRLQQEVNSARQTSGITDQTKAKRNEVRKAHQYLQVHVDPALIQIGPLPAWPEEKEPTQNLQTLEESTRAPLQRDQTPIQEHEPHTPSPPHRQQEDSQNTYISNLSISESAFAISPPPLDERTIRNGPAQEQPATEEESSARDRNTRRRARIAAYLAAREDSWVDISLTSAGNNHAEEEMEL